ncbi:MAG: CoA pyrophosphatase [Sediminicola sp.]
MEFDNFTERISKIKNLPLPGQDSHYKMAPEERIVHLKALDVQKKKPKMAAVMALFYPDRKGETHLLLILRKTYPGVHSNQVAFPGGKMEKGDADLEHTALRETSEEVGVAPHAVEVVRALSKIYIPPSNFEVQPFLGLYPIVQPFQIQESEVEALLEVPLRDFMDDGRVVRQTLTTSYAENIAVPAFELNGHMVWGATAMILSEVKELFKQVM